MNIHLGHIHGLWLNDPTLHTKYDLSHQLLVAVPSTRFWFNVIVGCTGGCQDDNFVNITPLRDRLCMILSFGQKKYIPVKLWFEHKQFLLTKYTMDISSALNEHVKCIEACSRQHLRIHFLVWNCVLCYFVFKLKLHWYFARNGSVNDMASLVGTMAWHTSGAKPLSRANGGIVYWRIKGVTKTRWLNVNKLINVVAFCVVSAIMTVNGVHTLKLTQSFTHAVNWSSQSVVGFRSREMPSNLNSWNEINQILW